MTKYLILVKHSLPTIMQDVPAREWMLSEEGRTHARLLADRLRQYRPEIVISSSEPKAAETGEIIAEFLGLPMQVVENLHEHDRSNATFLARDEFQAAVQEFFDKPAALVFGNETANQSLERFSKAVRAALSMHENKTTVIATHGTVISLFVSHLTDTSAFSLWNELGLPSFVVLDLDSNTMIAHENIT